MSESDNARAMLWALFAAALFSVAAAMAKIAINNYHVLQILFFRQLVVFCSSLPSIVRSYPESLLTQFPLIHVQRLLGAFVALSCGIWAVAVLPLSTAITLGFSQVFFVTLLALLFLNESIGRHRIAAVVVGFFGVLVVMRPGVNAVVDVHALIPVLGALGASVAITCVRRLSRTESTATLLVYQSVFVGLLAGVPLLWFWATPDLSGLMLLLAMGVLASAGQWIGVKALRMGDASVVGNIEYTKLIYAAGLGYLLFGEVPDGYTILGAAIITASSLYIFRRERLLSNER